MMRYVPVFILAFVVFMGVGGSFTLYDVLTGALTSLLTTALATPLLIEDDRKAVSLRRFLALLRFAAFYLTIAELKAHAQVVRSIIFNTPQLTPAIVRVRYESRSRYSVAASANSITNTPGTAVIDVDESKGVMYVHWLYAERRDHASCYRAILEPFEKSLRKVFE